MVFFVAFFFAGISLSFLDAVTSVFPAPQFGIAASLARTVLHRFKPVGGRTVRGARSKIAHANQSPLRLIRGLQ